MNMKQRAMKPKLDSSCGKRNPTVPQNAVIAFTVARRQDKDKKGEPDYPSASSRVNTEIEARVDVGWGNTLFIRGDGAGLTWSKGVPMNCFNGSTWVWLSPANGRVTFKLLLNDEIWAEGEDLIVEPGGKVELKPVFPGRPL